MVIILFMSRLLIPNRTRSQKLTANIELINFINTTVETGNDKHMRALDVFKYFIQYLYTRALEVIEEKTGDEDFGGNDVQLILTVPAIWKPAAKQFMREAAYQVSCHDMHISYINKYVL